MKGWTLRLRRAATHWQGAGCLALGAIALAGSGTAGAQTITPNTWNVIGLQGNNVTAGPIIFPVGARACAGAGALAAGYKARFQWLDRAGSVLGSALASNLSVDGPAEIVLPAMAANTCQDVYFNARINQVAGAFSTLADPNSRAPYRIALTTAANAAVATTPANREIYVEKLIAQNRNSILGYDFKASGAASTTAVAKGGSISVSTGGIYELTMRGRTATQGYEQLEQFLTLPTNLFQVLSVKSTYTANSGTDPAATRKLYADGCGWTNDYTNAAAYHTNLSCSGTGKYGGDVSVTYVFKVLAAPGTGYQAQGVIYDYSGSSYHYNADSVTSGITINVNSTPPPPQADLSVVKTASLSSPGNSDFVIKVTNNGPDAAANVVLTDAIPNGYTLKTGGGNAPSCDINGAPASGCNPFTGTWSISNLPAGQTATLNLHVQVKSNQPGLNYVNVASAQSDTQDPNPNNNTSQAGTPPASADLGVTKRVTSGSPIKVGDTVTFSINAFNQGPDPAAANAVVSDVLPAGLNYSPAGSSCAAGWGTISWNLPTRTATCTRTTNLPVDATPAQVMTLAATVQAPAGPLTDGTPYLNRASITAPTADPDTGNNSATASAMPTFLTIAKMADKATYTIGENGSYTLTIAKVGTSAPLGTITVTDILPAGVTLNGSPAISGTGWTCFDSTLTCSRSDAGDPAMTYPAITVNVKFNAAAEGAPQNLASVTGVQNPGTVNEKVLSYDETVRQVTVGNMIWNVSAVTSPASAGTTDCAAPGKDVTQGQGTACSATPTGSGYIFTGWTAQSGGANFTMCSPATNADCAVSNVTGNVVLQANFEYAVTTSVAKPANSSSTFSCGPAQVADGGSTTCTAVPGPGETYTFPNGCVPTGNANECKVSGITGPLNVPITFTKIDYTVAAVVSPAGSGTTGCTAPTVNYGDPDTCTAIPTGPGYIFTGWTTSSGSGSFQMCNPATSLGCTISNVTGNVVLQANFEYAVTTSITKPNGSVSDFTCIPTRVANGGSTTCTAAPALGETYTFPAGCVPTGNADECKVSGITGPLNVPITFKKIDYTVTASTTGGGTASCTPPTVNFGESSTCQAVPDGSHEFTGWTKVSGTADMCQTTTATECIVSAVGSNVALEAAFKLKEYPVTPAITKPAGSASTMTCSPNPVTHGSDVTCTISPASSETFTFPPNCAQVGSTSQCTVANVTGPLTVPVTFISQWNVTAAATPASGGSITACASAVVVNDGQGTTCTVSAPNAGHVFTGWSINSGSATLCSPATGTDCAITEVKSNVVLHANFDYTVTGTVVSKPPGSTSTFICDPLHVAPGGTATCTATPARGEKFTFPAGCTPVPATTDKCTITDIQEPKNLEISFTLEDYTVDASIDPDSPANSGSASCDPSSVTVGQQSTCTAKPKSGYRFTGWTGHCEGQGATCTLLDIGENKSSAAKFEKAMVAPVPTLGEWGLALMAMLTAALGLSMVPASRRR